MVSTIERRIERSKNAPGRATPGLSCSYKMPTEAGRRHRPECA